MRWLRTLVLIVTVIVVVSPTVVYAATFQEVTVVARPKVGGGITNFLITYVNDTRLDLSWTLVGDAVNIMIRGKYAGYPNDIPDADTAPSDGYLVYYGAGASVSDTSMDFNENPGTLYYRAWAQKADGKWYTTPEEGNKGSQAVMLLLVGLLPLGLTIAMFVSKTPSAPMLGFPAGIFWALLGGYAYIQHTATWDFYYLMFFAAMGMLIFCIYAQFALRRRDLAEPDADKGKFIDEGPDENRIVPAIEAPATSTAVSVVRRQRTDDFALPAPSSRVRGIRERAERRRTQGVIGHKSYGEFR